MPLPRPLLALFLALAALVAAVPLASAQSGGLFSPAIVVNDGAITRYEIAQRRLLLQVVGAPGDLDREAPERLIEDRLRLQAAAALGVRVTEDQIAAGMEEFAARANLTTEEFMAALAERGVAPETFRFFVEAGVAWREVIRLRFAARVAITETEIDRALALTSRAGAARVLLSEILLPATEEFIDRTAPLAEELSRTLRGEAAFADAARRFSAAGTREAGGRLDWIPLERIPSGVAVQILSLSPGQVTRPIRIGDVLAIFLLRGIEEGRAAPPEAVAVDYAQFFIPGGRSPTALAEAARLRARVDTCDDLYGEARGLPEERLVRETLPQSQVPQDIALELARLDENEISTELVRGEALVFLMLCGRTLAVEDGPSRDEIRNRLVNQRLNAFSDGYLAELRADAHIVFR
jgi:peptidyl-prolyl cis-trans isomerase SurA